MDMIEKVTELLTRLEAATGPDRELDAMLHVHASDGRLTEYDRYGWVKGPADIGEAPPVTASVDAALALCERVLPDRLRDFREVLDSDKGRVWVAWLSAYDGTSVSADAPTLPLALLTALVRALQHRRAGS